MRNYSIIAIIILVGIFSFTTRAACDFTTVQNVIITPNGNHNSAAGYTQTYILVDQTGLIVSTSSNGDFGTQNFGKYNAYAVNYESSNPPTTLPASGVDISLINDGCTVFSNALQITVCNISVLNACENSGTDIVVAMNADYNTATNYEEVIVIVDDVTGNILFVSSLNVTTGSVSYTTTAVTGDLTNGSYTAYSVNYENSETLAGLGLIAGNTWTGTFGASCAQSSTGVNITVNLCCTAGAGLTTAQTSDPSNNDFVLCWNESIDLENLTYSLPGVGSNEGFGYAVYSSPMPGAVPNSGDADFIEFLIGTGSNANITLTNDGSYTPPFINNPNQTIYLYPVTLDDTTIPAIDDNGDNCYAVGTEITITFLNDIIAPNTQDCLTGSGVYTISGGYPEFFTGNYNITNLGDGILSSSTLATNGGTVSVSNLNIGDVYNIDIIDDNNCSISTMPEIYPSNLSYDSIVITPVSCNNICDATVSVYSANASQFSFDGGSFSANFIQSNLCDGNLVVSIEDNGCVIDSTLTILEPTPVIISNSNDTTICVGSTISLTGNAQGGTPGYTYYWNEVLANSALNVTPSNDSTLSFFALDANNCSSDTNLISITLFDLLTIQANQLDSICEGENIDLTAIGSGGNNNLTYTWTNNAGTGWTAQGTTVNVSPTNDITYTIQLSDNCGTPSTTLDINILVNELPIITFNTDYQDGCYPLTANFSNTTSNVTTHGICNWTFSNGETSTSCIPSITFEEPGCFDATLTTESLSGCSNTTTFQSVVCVQEYPEASFSYTPTNPTIENSLVEFINESNGNVFNEWNLNGIEFSNELNPSYQFDDLNSNNQICLTVRNNYSCEAIFCDSVIVEDVFSMYVPNSFTPDGDGFNDYFKPIISESLLEDYEMWIFNRWGEIIFYAYQIEDSWDGKHKGFDSQQDTYVWLIKYKVSNVTGINEKTGHLNLLR